VAERIRPAQMAKPSGPWAPGVRVEAGRTLYVAGCIALDEHGQIVGAGDIRAQTHQVMRNFQGVVEAAGMTMRDVVKITNYLVDVADYEAMAEVRATYLREPYPASTMVEVTGLLYPELLVEIEGIAVAS
jgi:2-iminobutanoate/2-iminopropanoate deaminase